jgi:hypothetical protein
MDGGPDSKTLTTCPLIFSGRHLFINANAEFGELRVEVISLGEKTLVPFTHKDCRPIRVNSCCQQVTWRGTEDLAPVRGKPVRLRFHARNTQLFSFWISHDKSGASHGYVAGGGPGFTGPTDTVGLNKL